MRQKLTAEFIGTYFLIFMGTGAVIVNELTHTITHLGVALTFGLAVMALVYAFGHISGAHLNPAVTIAFFVNRDIRLKEALCYIATQCVAAVSASTTLYYVFGNIAHLGATIPRFSWQQSFVLETILTFALVLIVFGSAIHGKAMKSFAGIAIGATVTLEAMFGGPISGASMNPARSLGPALVSGVWEHQWIYVVATILGAVMAAFVYRLIRK